MITFRIVFTFLFPYLLGKAICYVVLPVKERNRSLHYFLAFGAGTGLLGLITFLCAFTTGQFLLVPVNVIAISLFLLLTFLGKNEVKPRSPQLGHDGQFIIFLLLTIFISIYLQILISSYLPNVFWDAWSFWNFRAALLSQNGENWILGLGNIIQAKHPWLLSSFLAWGWVMNKDNPQLITLLYHVLMCISLLGILSSMVLDICGKRFGILAGAILAYTPYFIYHSASLCADLPCSFYLLAVFWFCFRTTIREDKHNLPSAAFFMGLLLNTKSEGLLYLVLLFVIFRRNILSAHIFSNRRAVIILLVFSVPLLINEIGCSGLIPSIPKINSVIGDNVLSWKFLLEPQRYLDLFRYTRIVLFELNGLGLTFGTFWFVPLTAVILVLFRKAPYRSPTPFNFVLSSLILFMIGYLLAVSPLYWKINSTLWRLLYQLMPIVVLASIPEIHNHTVGSSRWRHAKVS